MTLTRIEAQDALRDISLTERRSRAVHGYGMSAPHLILWGVIWLLGYGLTAWRPALWRIWWVLVPAGVIGSAFIGRRSRSGAGRMRDWRYLETIAALIAFITALFIVLSPHRAVQIDAFFPILAAFYYMLIGIWTRGVRMMLLGVALTALTLVGFWLLPGVFAVWMALVGGGGLILGGVWLRSA